MTSSTGAGFKKNPNDTHPCVCGWVYVTGMYVCVWDHVTRCALQVWKHTQTPQALSRQGPSPPRCPAETWAGQPETKCLSPAAAKQRVTGCAPQPEVILTEGPGPTDTWPGQSQSHPEHAQSPQTHDPMDPIPALTWTRDPPDTREARAPSDWAPPGKYHPTRILMNI